MHRYLLWVECSRCKIYAKSHMKGAYVMLGLSVGQCFNKKPSWLYLLMLLPIFWSKGPSTTILAAAYCVSQYLVTIIHFSPTTTISLSIFIPCSSFFLWQKINVHTFVDIYCFVLFIYSTDNARVTLHTVVRLRHNGLQREHFSAFLAVHFGPDFILSIVLLTNARKFDPRLFSFFL